MRVEDLDHSHWMFRLETEKKNAQKEVDEVVETKNGDLKLPILINGRELTAKQQQESDKRLEQLLHSPEAAVGGAGQLVFKIVFGNDVSISTVVQLL